MVAVFQPGTDGETTVGLPMDQWVIVRELQNCAGRHLVLQRAENRLRLLIKPPHPDACRGYVVAVDDWLGSRHKAVGEICKLFEADKTCKAPTLLAPTDYQRHRLIQLLRILDSITHHPQGSPTVREIASGTVFPNSDFARAIEWKSSSERRQTQRLLSEARYFARTGYRHLLKGRVTRQKN